MSFAGFLSYAPLSWTTSCLWVCDQQACQIQVRPRASPHQLTTQPDITNSGGFSPRLGVTFNLVRIRPALPKSMIDSRWSTRQGSKSSILRYSTSNRTNQTLRCVSVNSGRRQYHSIRVGFSPICLMFDLAELCPREVFVFFRCFGCCSA